MELHPGLDWKVKIRGEWIPFNVFKLGRHREAIEKCLEEISGHTLDDCITHCLILAEQLGTDMKYTDEVSGIDYIITFKIGEETKMSNFISGTNRFIKVVRIGGLIKRGFESSLAYVLDI